MTHKKNKRFQTFIKALCATALLFSLSGCGLLYVTTLMATCTFQPDLTITPKALPHVIVGQPYHVNISVSETNNPMYDIVLVGELPDGLEFYFNDDGQFNNEATIEGIATETGTFPITIHAVSYGTQCVGQEVSQPYAVMSIAE